MTTANPDFCLAGGDPFSDHYDGVLDQLAGWRTEPHANLPAHLGGVLDLDRVGIVGHSLGGSTAAQALLNGPSPRYPEVEFR